jgi:hypothetical protein
MSREKMWTNLRERWWKERKKGKRIKSQAMDRKKLAQEATGPIGSSFMNLDKFAR